MLSTDIKQALLIIEQYPYGAACIGAWACVAMKLGELLWVVLGRLWRKFKLDKSKDGEN